MSCDENLYVCYIIVYSRFICESISTPLFNAFISKFKLRVLYISFVSCFQVLLKTKTLARHYDVKYISKQDDGVA